MKGMKGRHKELLAGGRLRHCVTVCGVCGLDYALRCAARFGLSSRVGVDVAGIGMRGGKGRRHEKQEREEEAR